MVIRNFLTFINCVQTNILYKTELFEIDLFDHLTVCKQMTDV